jgi:hypothetical protein
MPWQSKSTSTAARVAEAASRAASAASLAWWPARPFKTSETPATTASAMVPIATHAVVDNPQNVSSPRIA